MQPKCDQFKLQELKNGNLTPEQKLELLDHLQHCEACMSAFLNGINDLPQPPAGFAEQVSQTIRRDKKREFRFYCIRVCAAMCASVLLMFTGTFQFQTDGVPFGEMKYLEGMQHINKVTEKIVNGANNLFFMEGMNDDKAQ
jgi:hypothetical protein